MLPLTLFLARLLGLTFVIFAAAMVLNRTGMVAAIETMIRDRGLMLFGALINLTAGLAIVLAHNLWSGGALTVAVTMLGWLLLVRGVFWLLMPAERLQALYLSLRFEQRLPWFASLTAALGLALAIGGFGG